MHVAEQAVATAEQDVEHLSPSQRVLHALAVCVVHPDEDDVAEENDVISEDTSLV